MAAFDEKLAFVAKALSISRGRLGLELGVSKSVISRWFSGARTPTSTNLAAITALVAQQVPGFSLLDWDSDLDVLAKRLGVERVDIRSADDAGLSPLVLEQIRLGTESRGAAYEGFFRSTRPFAASPGRYTHDLIIIRLDADGKLRSTVRNSGVFVDSWLAPINQHLYSFGAERTSGSLVFGLLNGAPREKVTMIDGLIMSAIFDLGRTPTSTAVVYERIGDLTAMGSFLIMGLIGIILASLVNIFLHSSMIHFIVSLLGVGIFAGLTAYDTQKLKMTYYQLGGNAAALNVATSYGALNLYLDFINLFQFLMALLGGNRR